MGDVEDAVLYKMLITMAVINYNMQHVSRAVFRDALWTSKPLLVYVSY